MAATIITRTIMITVITPIRMASKWKSSILARGWRAFMSPA
jgi:hypothetical protein